MNGGYIDFSMATQGTQIKLKENHIDALKIEAINALDLMRFDTLNKRVLVNGHVDVNGSLSYTQIMPALTMTSTIYPRDSQK